MKQRRAVLALGISIVVLSALLAVRRFVGRRAPVAESVPSASATASLPGARSAPLPPPVLSASTPLPLPTPARPPAPPYLDVTATTLDEQRSALFTNMQNQLELPAGALEKIEAIFAASNYLGQGEPKITKHPMTRAECRAIRASHPELHPEDPRCKARYMVPLFDPGRGETADDASVCIDQFEFPNIPCEYPVTWVRSSEAAELCEAQGKRLCDAHEWEGACAGALHTPEVDYTFGERRIMQEYLHNKTRELIWAYGPKVDHQKCGTTSHKSRECYTPDWGICGSNTFPAGAFPDCVSRFGVFDQHGNAAEHMNLPVKPEQLGKNGGVGETEMKGSWFIFASEAVHPDDCRWRALMWHAGPIRAADSHRNYHLGFRCCKDISPSAPGKTHQEDGGSP
ncbi:MAG TPA: SUMF1/EgtB/PvdO family nonheme iron enzyme [Polyangiaceae bacterium]|nr:SUMF1/EgtB/PvdO family nonheme iron enzyme [Polyangiaceae bacterium]